MISPVFTIMPDLVVIISGPYVPQRVYEIAKARSMKVALIHTESPYEDNIQIQRAQMADINVLNDPTNLDRFLSVAPNTVYIPHAYDPDVHHPGKVGKAYRSEVCFVGTGYDSRIEFLEAIDWSGIDFALGGYWRNLTEASPLRPFMAHDLEVCMDNSETVKAYRGTLASFNLYRKESNLDELSAGWSMGPREVELSATGTWFARQSRPEGDDLFPMLPVFSTPDELTDQLRWALAHPDERQAAAKAARAACADRTFTNNARQLLQLVGV
jgi:spore maturation protein CgeB